MTINSLGAAALAPATDMTPTPHQAAQNRVLSQAVRVINNSSLTPQDRQLSLSLDQGTKILVAKVVDPSTGQVLDQMPSEDVLRLAAYLEAQSREQQTPQTIQRILG